VATLIWTLLSVGAVLVFLALVIARERMADERLWPVWRTALAGDDALGCAAFQREVGAHLSGVERTLRLARDEHAAGRTHAATRVLRLAAHSALRLARKLDAWLRTWRDLARALAAVRPAAPPLIAGLRAWTLRAYALAARGLDLMLVTSGERFRVRVALLRRALRRVRVAFTRLARAARARPHALARTLRRADDTHADLGALADACARTLEALAVSRQSQAPRDDARPPAPRA
jgi:hypothetical protein